MAKQLSEESKRHLDSIEILMKEIAGKIVEDSHRQIERAMEALKDERKSE